MRPARAALLLASLGTLLLLGTLSHGTPLSVVGAIDRMWQDVALQAAEATVAAIKQQTGAQLSLLDVPMDTFQIQVGRQHQLAIEVDGRAYDLMINQQEPQQRLQLAGASLQPKQALPATGDQQQDVQGTSKATHDPWEHLQPILLPEITLAGPCELVLSHPASINLWLPHSAEVARARRMLLAPGVAVTLSQLKGIGLRRPVELPRLPASYLAEVYATQKLGEPEPGFENSPGMYYLANQLYRAATNASLDAARGGTHLLSFDVEPAGPSMTMASAAFQPGVPAPRLKVKRQKDGSLEVSLRGEEAAADGQLAGHAGDAARQGSCSDSTDSSSSSSSSRGGRGSSTQSCSMPAGAPAAAGPPPGAAGIAAASALALQPNALLVPQQKAWAWPLPLVDMSGWLSYESLLRGILGSHPFDLQQVVKQGIGLKLTRSSVRGVSLLHFDLQLRGKGLAPEDEGVKASDVDPNFAHAQHEATSDDSTLQVWEAVVQVVEAPMAKGAVQYIPLSVKRKHAYHSTLTLSPAAMAQLAGAGNSTGVLRGYESVDHGVARASAEQHQQ